MSNATWEEHNEQMEKCIQEKFSKMQPKRQTGCPPDCNATRITKCNCLLRDSKCNNGHEWHYVNNVLVLGPAHHCNIL